MLGGLFWLLRPATHVPAPAPAAPSVRSAPAEPTLAIRGGRRVGGPDTIHAVQGDELRIRLVSDQDVELHLHGYDLHLHLRPGVPGELAFVAAHSGRFELELHGAKGAHEALTVVEVQPK